MVALVGWLTEIKKIVADMKSISPGNRDLAQNHWLVVLKPPYILENLLRQGLLGKQGDGVHIRPSISDFDAAAAHDPVPRAEVHLIDLGRQD